MPSESSDTHEQEHSIKAREKELYVRQREPGVFQPTKPFETYLRETPAQPLSTFTKVVLWFVGIVVVVLLFAALWRISDRYGPVRRPRNSPQPAVTKAISEDADPSPRP
jgi:hypothetical protein